MFEYIEVGICLIGHTHSDIDQTFGCTSWRLKTENKITMDYLHAVLCNCYNKFTIIKSFKQKENSSLLYEKSGSLNNVNSISQYCVCMWSSAPVYYSLIAEVNVELVVAVQGNPVLE